ncbi:MAG: hypothetical protein AAF823_10000 [Planctomycetota bacterium]
MAKNDGRSSLNQISVSVISSLVTAVVISTGTYFFALTNGYIRQWPPNRVLDEIKNDDSDYKQRLRAELDIPEPRAALPSPNIDALKIQIIRDLLNNQELADGILKQVRSEANVPEEAIETIRNEVVSQVAEVIDARLIRIKSDLVESRESIAKLALDPEDMISALAKSEEFLTLVSNTASPRVRPEFRLSINEYSHEVRESNIDVYGYLFVRSGGSPGFVTLVNDHGHSIYRQSRLRAGGESSMIPVRPGDRWSFRDGDRSEVDIALITPVIHEVSERQACASVTQPVTAP